ncbi:DUF6356 family protein [Pseudooctadecabacter jejudonensis]|uniref:Capsule biosynthesis protein n=1 Tax=Pseudooctadecabacter jejudonensis TaxID=1391910 RepID=A0A1Y5T421_9RHOB|nr:DUF6356 family protein [Pseudooctadecabacter jejudonensis]SLN53532.1 hypothetical protein PSJ8397_02785 [Pseudooctadecabacter jejudonensis]
MTDITPPNRTSLLDRWFLAHPASVDETYLQHMRFAAGFAFWLAVAAAAAVIHALIPRLCETTASQILRKLTARMEARH